MGTHVVTLRGQDPEGAPVSYTISGDHFSADRSSGKVTLVKKLDREEVSFIDVVVSVQDDQPDGITAVSRRIRGKNHRLSVILVKRIHTPQRIAFCIALMLMQNTNQHFKIKVTLLLHSFRGCKV